MQSLGGIPLMSANIYICIAKSDTKESVQIAIAIYTDFSTSFRKNYLLPTTLYYNLLQPGAGYLSLSIGLQFHKTSRISNVFDVDYTILIIVIPLVFRPVSILTGFPKRVDDVGKVYQVKVDEIRIV